MKRQLRMIEPSKFGLEEMLISSGSRALASAYPNPTSAISPILEAVLSVGLDKVSRSVNLPGGS